MIAILDYGSGNQTSVRRALELVGVPGVVTADSGVVWEADGVIFPGVGAAGQAMTALGESGLGEVLKVCVAGGKPLLGVCLGCQILLEHSEENDTNTLGILPGVSRRFGAGLNESGRDEKGERILIPHMGWNGVELKRPCRLFAGVEPEAEFYFVHSYYVEVPSELVLGVTRYGREFCSVCGRDGLWAVQFHVEKSGRPGLRMLRNFYDYCQEVKQGAPYVE